MAIHNYCGLPGSGKSYSVVEQVLIPALKDGRRIVTNVPLKMETIYEDYPSADIELFDLTNVASEFFDLDLHESRRGAVWIIDECWKRFPQGTRVDAIPKPVGAFFAEHRHFVGDDGFSTEIVLVCQSITQLAAFIRELVDTTYITKKMDKVGQDGRFRVDIYAGPQNLTRPDREQFVRQSFGTYKKSVWRYYSSHTRNRTSFGAGNEKTVGRSGSIWKSPIFILGIPAGVIGATVAVVNLVSFFGGSHAQADVAAPGRSSPSAQVQTFGAVATSAPLRDPALSEKWRLVGVVWRSGRDGLAVLQSSEGSANRTIPVKGNCSTVRNVPHKWTCQVDGQLVTEYSGNSAPRGMKL